MQLHQLEQAPHNGVSFLSGVLTSCVSFVSGVLTSCEILDLDNCRLVDTFIFKEKFPLTVLFEHKSLKKIRFARKR